MALLLHQPWHSILASLPESGTGRVMLVEGDPRKRGQYLSGLQLPMAETLAEALMRIFIDGPWEIIDVMAGVNLGHLPPVSLGSGRRLGDCPLVYRARGPADPKPGERIQRLALRKWEQNDELERRLSSRSLERVIWQGLTASWGDRMNQLEAQCAVRAQERRRLLLVDATVLIPGRAEQKVFLEHAARPDFRVLANHIRSRFTASLEEAAAGDPPVDVVFFGETPLLEELLTPEGAVLRTYFEAELGERFKGSVVEAAMSLAPPLRLPAGTELLRARRQICVLDDPVFEIHGTPATLYEALRTATIRTGSIPPRPPENPEHVDLERFSQLDLEAVARTFDEEMIGQGEAKRALIESLQEMKTNCATVLEGDPDAVRTARDEYFNPPVITLAGEAGAGKTYLLDLLIEALFGDPRFGIRIDMAGKSMDAVTHGVRPPMIGCDHPGELHSFAEENGGLGVVCFDEFTRIHMERDQSIADALGPLLQILEDRRLTPANPRFNPPGRYVHLANMLFVFAGNISEADPAPEGFVSLRELGSAFHQRQHRIVHFRLPTESELAEGVRRAVVRAAKTWAQQMERPVPDSIVLDDRLGDFLVAEAQAQAQRDPRSVSYRTLLREYRRLDFRAAWAAYEGNESLVLDASILPPERS